ncbi:MAG: hypothetical protein GYA24_22750 [Candidatus Lokiarchaeota archaeon]|nr:hypothetical protein [Candidatus Lokiarchaeota archaeon]
MEQKQPTCYMKVKGLSCIKTTSPVPKDVDCSQCLWNMRSSSPGSIAAMEKLFSRYKASISRTTAP